MIVALLACTTPPLLGSLAEKLAQQAVDEAEPGIRLQIATASMLAESCAVEEPKTHVFSGPGAAALGIYAVPEFLKDDATGKIYWSFEPAALDGGEGKLVFETDSTRQNFNVFWAGGEHIFEGDMQVLYCDEAYHSPRTEDAGSASRASYTGGVETGSWDTGDTTTTEPDPTEREAIISAASSYTDQALGESSTINSLGSEPYAGLAFVPVLARLPISGYPRWTSADEETKITLLDASVLPAGAASWPGTATTNQWESEVLVPL